MSSINHVAKGREFTEQRKDEFVPPVNKCDHEETAVSIGIIRSKERAPVVPMNKTVASVLRSMIADNQLPFPIKASQAKSPQVISFWGKTNETASCRIWNKKIERNGVAATERRDASGSILSWPKSQKSALSKSSFTRWFM